MNREIKYSPRSHDYDAYLDGEYIGSYKTHLRAENALDKITLERGRRAQYIAHCEKTRVTI